MFFPNSMKIKNSDLVLEIGGGAFPYWRSDCLADVYDEASDVDLKQFGGSKLVTKGKPLFKIVDNKLPFKDNSFDYVICSHVFEHVPIDELQQLALEIMRVSKKAYIEFPRLVYDLIYNLDVHLNLMDIVDGEIICIDKKNTKLNELKLFQNYSLELRIKNLYSAEVKYENIMAVGYEFQNKIPIKIISDEKQFVDLISKSEYRNNRPSLFWLIKNKIHPKRICKNIVGEKAISNFTELLITKP